MYEVRFYRDWISRQGLVTFSVQVGETDLTVRARRELKSAALALVQKSRAEIEDYGRRTPGFLESLSPLPIPALRQAQGPEHGQGADCPPIVCEMLRAGQEYDVGPMAAVAGAIAEAVGRELLRDSPEVIVENGGDIFFKTTEPPTFGLYAGKNSPFTGKVRFAPSEMTEGGVCTSSGTVGHSISFGHADAVTVLARNVALADAAATAIANSVRTAEDVQRAIDIEKERGILAGGLVAIGNALGAWGSLEILEGA